MLSFLPVLLAAGYLQTMAGLNPDPEMSGRKAAADVFNMTVHHNSAYHDATSNGFATGPVSAVAPAPFRNLQAWRNEIAADAGGAVLLTWATDFAANDGISWPLGNAYSLMRQFDPDSDQPAQMFVGLYSVDGSGQTFVGGIRIPEPVAEIAVGAPVLATRIR